MHNFELTLGLPHTNHRGFSESALMMYAGHFQWTAIAHALGCPLSDLRTREGSEVYAAFYFIETSIPERTPLETFNLDDTLQFSVALRAFKTIAVEGQLTFDRRPGDESPTGDVPRIRFGNIFITPVRGNSLLRVAPPAGVAFTGVPVLPNDENPYHLTRAAAESGALGLIDQAWAPAGTFEHSYTLDVDRDTNGAGLVYFARYVTFMQSAERFALREAGKLGPGAYLSLRHRRIAYYANADPGDALSIVVSLYRDAATAGRMGVRYTVTRREDGQRICLSEAVKEIVDE